MVVKSQFRNSALIHFTFIHGLMCLDFMWVCFVYKELRYVFESNRALWNIFHFLMETDDPPLLFHTTWREQLSYVHISISTADGNKH